MDGIYYFGGAFGSLLSASWNGITVLSVPFPT